MEKILKAEGLTRAFENKGERFLAVRDVSFSLYRGEALGIVGESGSGKSTLVRMLTGLLAPTKGKNRVFEQRSYPCGEQRMEEVLSGNAAGVSASEGVLRFRKKRWEAELGRA